jgi:hypothetical protein
VEFEPMEEFERNCARRLSAAGAAQPEAQADGDAAARNGREPRRHVAAAGGLPGAGRVLGGAVLPGISEKNAARAKPPAQQVLIALRITGHALNQMNQQLAAHGARAE